MERESYDASFVLIGEHLAEDDIGQFCGVLLELQDLLHWIGRTGLSYSGVQVRDGKTPESITIQYNLLHKETRATEAGDLEINFPTQLNMARTQFRIEESCQFGFHFSRTVQIQDAMSICEVLQNLVTVCSYGPVGIVKISLLNRAAMEETDEGEPGYKLIDVYTRFAGSQAKLSAGNSFRHALFRFDDIGGLEGVTAWLSLAERYRSVIGLLHGHWYLPETFVETRFLHMVIAAEALERIRQGQQQVALRQALLRIAEDAGELAEHLVGGIPDWADEIVKVRAANVVHRGLRQDADTERVYYLSESLYMLIVTSLMQECGVPASTLSSIQQHSRFRWLANGLQQAG